MLGIEENLSMRQNTLKEKKLNFSFHFSRRYKVSEEKIFPKTKFSVSFNKRKTSGVENSSGKLTVCLQMERNFHDQMLIADQMLITK